jgi:type IV pilus assembly protein PilY1
VTYVVPANALGTPTSFTAALVNGYYTEKNGWTVNLATAYRPTLSLTFTTSGSSLNFTQNFADHAAADLGTGAGKIGTTSATSGTNVRAYYYVYDTSLSGCTQNIADDSCYRLQQVRPSEEQNFAIWYSYYRTRHLAMISGAWRVMSDPNLIGTRVAWQATNTRSAADACNSFAGGNTCTGYNDASNSVSGISNLIDEFSASRRTALQNWLRRLTPASASGTSSVAPLRSALDRAGQYYSSTATSNNPYLAFPQQSASPTANPEYACRPNFHLLIAGGVYDDSDSGSYCSNGACGNTDAISRTLPAPDSVSYSGTQRPFADANSNSLADVAFHYWATDLRSGTSNGLANVLLPYIRDRSGGSASAQYWNPRNDPARWQHMVNFTVGVGVRAALADPNIPWTGDAFGGTGFANLLSGAANWPATTLGSNGRIYDLWHAALNSRGEFFSSETPEQIVDAMTSALSRTIDQANVGASLAANSTRLTTQSLLYQASFDTRDWTGRLRAINVNTDGTLGRDAWAATATGNIPAASARNIFTSSAAVASGIDFTWAALGTAGLQPRIGSPDVLDYLRGDQSNEAPNGTYPNGGFRNRGVRLGDIVNSEIAFAGSEDFGYDALVVSSGGTLTGEGLAYPAYLQSKTVASRPKLVMVGANDGMFHGFDGDNGRELFAYVPRSVLLEQISSTDVRSNLVRLADPAYTHRFYVDGSPWVGDAYWGGAWRTVVVSTTGAGAQGVFAIDISDPANVGPSKVLWDIDGQSDPDLGYTIGQAIIGRLNDGNFWAIFGNGYRSSNECAVLYLVRLPDGFTRRISTSAASSCASTPNGLGRPSLHDNQTSGEQGFRIADWAYAGDLRGNLWKFDLTSSNPANWRVAIGNSNSPTPLFHARTATGSSGVPQPITGTIEIGVAPSGITAPNNGGRPAMLWFGTGRYFAVGDRTDVTMQTMYGILDRGDNSAINDATGNSAGSRSMLVEQTRTFGANETGTVSSNAVAYLASGNSRRDGWYINLTTPSGVAPKGERIVGLPLIQRGRLVVATLIPDEDKCAGGGTSSILAVDPYTGGALASNKKFFLGSYMNTSFQNVDFIGSRVGIIRNLVYIGTGSKGYLYSGGTSGNVHVDEVRPDTEGAVRGRVSWREIVK